VERGDTTKKIDKRKRLHRALSLYLFSFFLSPYFLPIAAESPECPICRYIDDRGRRSSQDSGGFFSSPPPFFFFFHLVASVTSASEGTVRRRPASPFSFLPSLSFLSPSPFPPLWPLQQCDRRVRRSHRDREQRGEGVLFSPPLVFFFPPPSSSVVDRNGSGPVGRGYYKEEEEQLGHLSPSFFPFFLFFLPSYSVSVARPRCHRRVDREQGGRPFFLFGAAMTEVDRLGHGSMVTILLPLLPFFPSRFSVSPAQESINK